VTSDDLTDLLHRWPDVPGAPMVRIVKAVDGRQVVQRRIEMGVIQMEMSGRPDGHRPDGVESVLDAFRMRWRDGPANPSEDELAEAMVEARQYLQRAVAQAMLGQLTAAGQDALHARCVLAFGADRRLGADARDAFSLTAQAILLWVRAEVANALRERGGTGAIAAIDRGLDELSAMLGGHHLGESAFDGTIGSGVPGFLRALRASLVPKLPSSQREELRRRLEEAIRAENFELATILRDELRQMES